MGPIIHPAQCSASVFASFSLTQFSFSHPVQRCLNRKCISADLCAHGHAGLKKGVFSGALMARFYFEELKIDCAINQLKPGLKSPGLKSMAIKKMRLWAGPQRRFTLLIIQWDVQQHTNMPNIKKFKDYSVKKI